MAPSSGELWGHHLMPQTVLVDCLLPNGVIVPLQSYREWPLSQIKANLWKEAENYPLFHLLQERKTYVFVSVTQDAEREEFYDESRRLCDLRLHHPVLKLVEPKGNKEEKMLNYDVGVALGVAVHEFDELQEPEAHEWRRRLVEVCQDTLAKRGVTGKESRSLYAFPPEVENSPELPESMKGKLDRTDEGSLNLRVAVWSLSEQREKQKYTVSVEFRAFPEQIVREAILKRIRHSEVFKSQEDKNKVIDEHQSAYVLKVAGSDQYFLQPCPISQYKYIRACLARNEVPQLMLMSRKGVYDSLPDTDAFHVPAYYARKASIGPQAQVPPISENAIKLWHLDNPFKIRVHSASYVNVKEADLIYVRVGVYHGTEALCQVRKTSFVSHTNPRWDCHLEFDLFSLDLPRAAKLCASICAVRRSGTSSAQSGRSMRSGRGGAAEQSSEEHTMLCWGNVSLFDWRGRLVSGRLALNLWGVPRDMDDLLNPLGCVGSNPLKDSPCLELELDSQSDRRDVIYPAMDDFREYAKFAEGLVKRPAPSDPSRRGDSDYNVLFFPAQESINDNEKSLLKDIASRDPLAEISEQEKMSLWRLRRHCCNMYPDILPRFLDAVKWNSRDDITQLYILLEKWPTVKPQIALELLDCKYADPTVRSMAVSWLDSSMSDEDIAQFLMQLVQTLKYEPHLDCPLAVMLLRRALLNRKIGHFFFWHLRSELHNPALVVRYGLLLEAFCRGLGPTFLKKLIKQVEALDKLTKLTDSMREKLSNESIKERMRFISEKIQQPDYIESLQFFNSPLENTVMLGELDIPQCKVMDSAKKPLWLVWKNPDELAERLHEFNAIIFKNGDDLRQDMLTLQVISIMDHIWHMEGLDMRMTPYTCLATGHQVGMIQVVRNAKTVYQIQRKAGKLAAIQVDSTQLFKWIRERNKTDLQRAIETFTLSCAGYCVATFILGIGDRHPDNIMVGEDGQIFHIDFGHFLGHFKKKFGINRERVPFVLTEDFLLVIGNGQENPRKGSEFARFQELCGKAYLALRKHSSLLITLFTMMLPTGIAELQSINDVGYLRQTLAVEKTDEEALAYFQAMFYDAYGGAWTTKLDWFFHGLRHGV